MNKRERHIACMLRQHPDKIPFMPGGPREKTLKRWAQEGLDPQKPWKPQLYEAISLPHEYGPAQEILDVSFKMIPIFEEKVLEHINGHYIVQDWMGAITEISDEYDYTYIREAIDFVTRKWHKFPVETRQDFEEMKKRYNVDDPLRFPEDFKEKCVRLKERDDLLTVTVNGPFWQLREWCGFEGLCMKMMLEPYFVMEMMEFWKGFVTQVLSRILDGIVFDRLYINEDMAYKAHSMISPEMTRRFVQPCYDEWVPLARQAGVPIIEVDSDGCVEELIPIWIESDINVCSPIEVAAHNDLVAYSRLYKDQISYVGGVDKRCIAKGGDIIAKEMERLAPVIKSGGYIPGCDHGVPHDISWQNFIGYCKILAQLTGWL